LVGPAQAVWNIAKLIEDFIAGFAVVAGRRRDAHPHAPAIRHNDNSLAILGSVG